MKLQYSHKITEKRMFGKVTINQEMIVEVDYCHTDGSIGNPEVSIYQDGKFVCEISKLLHKAEGNPLITILEAIDWNDVFMNKIEIMEAPND